MQDNLPHGMPAHAYLLASTHNQMFPSDRSLYPDGTLTRSRFQTRGSTALCACYFHLFIIEDTQTPQGGARTHAPGNPLELEVWSAYGAPEPMCKIGVLQL